MSTTDPRPAGQRIDDRREPPLSRLVGRRPNQGAAVAAKTVISDMQALVRAEIDLAKAEIAEGVKAKVMGAGLFIAVAVIGWLAVQVFLVFLGFLFALFLPGWAAVGLVLLLLVIAMGVLGYLGYRKLQVPASLTTTKETVAESKSATNAAVDQLKGNAKQGVADAKVEVKEAAQEVVTRAKEMTGRQPVWPEAADDTSATSRPAPGSGASAAPARPAATATVSAGLPTPPPPSTAPTSDDR